jgi:hypothetical protein
MSPGITVSLHLWRGIGGDVQRELFSWRYRFGFVTVAIERTDILAAYRKLRIVIEERVEADRSKFGIPLAQAHESENYWRTAVKRSRSQDEIEGR